MAGKESLGELLAALMRPAALAELGVLALCVAFAWALVRLTRRRSKGSIWFGDRGFDGALFPLLALALTWIARLALAPHLTIALLKLAVPILASLAIIRVVVRVLHVAFPKSPVVRTVERTVSWGVWLMLVLWITDLLPLVLAELDALQWKIAGTNVSLRSLLEGAFTALAALVLVLWLSAAIEARLLAAGGVNLSLRKIAANATRAVLMLIGLLVALSAAGIPIGALGVLGGAVGVGIGFGLQKVASNYISGFIILLDRSVRIGDLVTVDNKYGAVSQINTRYTLLKAMDGTESIVPNEMLISQTVVNHSLSKPNVRVSLPVQVSYDTDLEQAQALLLDAAREHPRVIRDDPPKVYLKEFADNGVNLELAVWISDAEEGQNNLRSDLNWAIWRRFKAAKIEIPFPQRVVHMANAEVAGAGNNP